MIKYDKYKDSGVDWLGEIPEHWEDKRIKDVFKKFGSGTTPSTSRDDYYENGAFSWLNTTDLNNDLVFDTKQKITQTALKESGLKIYPVNALAIAMYGQGKTRGTVGLLQIPTTTNQAACIMYSPKGVNTKYILYWFIHKYDAIRSINIGATQPNMNQDFVKFLVLQCPPVLEQTAIATYLDSKTSAIDRKIALLEQKITHYQQLRKSLINETVCRGLDKNVKLKDSGIEWIGEIPKHWKIERLKDICGFINRGSSPNYVETGSHKVVNQATFSKGFWDESSLRFTQNFEVKPRGLLKEDDILIASTGGGVLGKVYFFNRKESDYIADSHITILRDTRKSYFSKYVYYYFSEKFKLINDILAQGSTNQTELQRDWLLAFFICIPPQAEQTAIANYLDEKTQMIDSIVSNIKTQIGTLKELRKTLINDVVTGKIKVSEL